MRKRLIYDSPDTATLQTLFQSPPDVAVVGAGGAGLLAGIAAARAGARTIVFERKSTPAKKVAISGGGRCNFSNTLDARAFVQNFGDRNVKKLGTALKSFPNEELIHLLKKYDVHGQIERNYRLYTKSGRGADVVEALAQEMKSAGGKLFTNVDITNLKFEDNQLALTLNGADVEHLEFNPKAIILCTGGLSYPVTGSTGDGYKWVKALDHKVTPLRAALVGLTIAETWPKKISGTAWPDAALKLFDIDAKKKKPICVERAEILFTHFGISGPAVLDISNAFVRAECKRAELQIDFFPDQEMETLEKEIQETIRANPKRKLAIAFKGLLPNRLLEHLQALIDPLDDTYMNQLSKAQRKQLLNALKSLTLTITGTRGIEYGEVTSGGIDWNEVDPKTMASKKVPGLFFAGEILDIAGRCGGFNLQAAFSTGYLAGQMAADFSR